MWFCPIASRFCFVLLSRSHSARWLRILWLCAFLSLQEHANVGRDLSVFDLLLVLVLRLQSFSNVLGDSRISAPGEDVVDGAFRISDDRIVGGGSPFFSIATIVPFSFATMVPSLSVRSFAIGTDLSVGDGLAVRATWVVKGDVAAASSVSMETLVDHELSHFNLFRGLLRGWVGVRLKDGESAYSTILFLCCGSFTLSRSNAPHWSSSRFLFGTSWNLISCSIQCTLVRLCLSGRGFSSFDVGLTSYFSLSLDAESICFFHLRMRRFEN